MTPKLAPSTADAPGCSLGQASDAGSGVGDRGCSPIAVAVPQPLPAGRSMTAQPSAAVAADAARSAGDSSFEETR